MPASKQLATKKKSVRKGTLKNKIAAMTAARLQKKSLESPSISTSDDSIALQVSASRRKLILLSPSSSTSTPSPSPVDSSLPTAITDLNTLIPLFQGLSCKFCGLATLSLVQGKGSKAFAVDIKVMCTSCGEVNNETFTSPKATSQSFDVNRRIVAAGLSVGLGHSGMERLSEGLGLSGMHVKTYQMHLNCIYEKATGPLRASILQDARDKVFNLYAQQHPDSIDSDGILNLAVSFDGTWPKRGHTSKLGVGLVIDVRTGLIIDFHVMSLHCHLCSTTGAKLKDRSDAAFIQWRDHHMQAGTCTQNYRGSSGGMEVEAAKVLWRRSLSHKMRYTILVGDGDTKTFLAVSTDNPYGDAYTVQKQECVNHVAKRLGTGLRNLKSTLSKKSIRIGGKAKGSLTDTKIGLLQTYYTRAVRGHNTSVEAMSKAIWASFYHSISTDVSPQHHYCEEGAASRCWYQRQIFQGISQPVNPSDHQSATFLNSTVAEHVKSVYERLTDPALLSRCLLGMTQNTNESVHSVIWSRCPKHLWNGYKRVFIATLLGVGEFNMGSEATSRFLSTVGCTVAASSRRQGVKRDQRRIQRADAAQEEVVKRRRETRRLASQRAQEQSEAAEGGPSYVPGGF